MKGYIKTIQKNDMITVVMWPSYSLKKYCQIMNQEYGKRKSVSAK